MFFRSIRSVLLVVLLLIPSFPSQSQTSRPRSRPANVVSGTLVALDEAAATLKVKPKTGTEQLFRYTEKTLVWKGRKRAEATDFKAGDGVVVRFRKSAVGPATLYDLCDPASWEWVDRLRHETTPVTVRAIDDENLTAAEGADAAEFVYRVTDKTQWSKGGTPAAPTDFKAGDKVYVVPRLLPGGATMGVAVSDATTDAAKLKERSRFTVTGTVRTVNVEKRTLSLHTLAGDDRGLTLMSGCVIRMSSKDVPLSYVRPGVTVTAHLTRDEAGDQVVKQVTIKPKSSIRTSGARTKPVPKKP